MRRCVFWATAFLVGAPTWAAFERPSANARLAALGDLSGEPAPLRRLLQPEDDWFPISLPGPDDWLSFHRESGQTYADYLASEANRPDAGRQTIYLLPIGDFPEETSPPLNEVRDYAAAFFQMKVKVLPAYDPHDLEFEPRKNPHTRRRQVRTSAMREFLKGRLPADAYCLLGITMTDLYPAPSWNYVFGEASLAERVGIYSFARYDPAFFGDDRGANFRDVILRRSCKVLAHEMGHLFGLKHCIYYDCVLNGSNNLDEADARPPHLCPVCLRKLRHCAGFDAVKRYGQLEQFYVRHRWYREADWVARQLEKVQPSRRRRRPRGRIARARPGADSPPATSSRNRARSAARGPQNPRRPA
jgi:archaemetzincin